MKIKQKIAAFVGVCCLTLILNSNLANSQASLKPNLFQDHQLLVSSLKGDTESVAKMLLSGVDPNTPPNSDDKGMTALMLAAWKGHGEIVSLLVRAGADLNAVSTSGSTAVMFASFRGHAEIVRMLVTNKADVNLHAGDSPLQTAVKRGDLAVVEALLEADSALEVTDKYGQTPLMMAARNGHTLIVIRLLNQGASINARDAFGATAMTKAAVGKHRAVLQVLRSNGGAF